MSCHTAENGQWSGFKSKHLNFSLDYDYMHASELYSQFTENATYREFWANQFLRNLRNQVHSQVLN